MNCAGRRTGTCGKEQGTAGLKGYRRLRKPYTAQGLVPSTEGGRYAPCVGKADSGVSVRPDTLIVLGLDA